MGEYEARQGLEVGEFLKFTADDNILLEIFLRLPEYFSVFDCSCVCRRWRRVISHPKFSHMFQRQLHGSATRKPLTLLLIKSKCRRPQFGHWYGEPMKLIFSLSLSISTAFVRHLPHHASAYLDFLPTWRYAVVKASCKDLLLVQLPTMQLCVCNPLTRRWFSVPELRLPRKMLDIYTYALACDPISGRGYRVVRFKDNSVDVFNSETWEWREDLPHPPEPEERLYHMDWKVTTQDGVVYSPLKESRIGFLLKKIVAFDPFDLSGGTLSVGLPRGFKGGWRAMYPRAQIWVVRGRLRLWQAYWDKVKNGGSFVFRLWELRKQSNDWDQLQNLALTRAGDTFTSQSLVFALHSEDDNTFYLRDDRPILWQYHIGSGISQMINCESPSSTLACFQAFPLVHPAWPTDVS